MTRPSFQFYPGDWLRDAALRSVSIEARGLWIDMLCLMHQGTPYGHLKVNQKVIDEATLARMLGIDERLTTRLDGRLTIRLLEELKHAGVCGVAEDGSLFSRRMVRDENIRCKRAAAGSLGGNPVLKRRSSKVNHVVKHEGYPYAEDEEEALPSSGRGAGGTSLPATEAQAKEWAEMENVPGEFAAEIYNQCDGKGWVDGAGQAITKWRPYIKQRWSKAQRMKTEQNENRPSLNQLSPDRNKGTFNAGKAHLYKDCGKVV